MQGEVGSEELYSCSTIERPILKKKKTIKLIFFDTTFVYVNHFMEALDALERDLSYFSIYIIFQDPCL